MASRTGFGLTSSARTGMPVGHACCSIFLTFIATVFLLAAWLSMPSTAVATEPELPRLYVNTTYVPPTGRTLAVSTGGDFQAALNAAQLGDVITLQAGATFTGPFTLPRQGGTGWITIRTSAADAQLPPAGTRITPAYASVLPKLLTGDSQPAVLTAPGAHHYRFIGVEFGAHQNVTLTYNIIRLGNESLGLSDQPHHLIFDRVYIHGHPTLDVQRGIAMNCRTAAVIDSYISEIHMVGTDAQTIAAWVGPGPFKIVNNYLQ